MPCAPPGSEEHCNTGDSESKKHMHEKNMFIACNSNVWLTLYRPRMRIIARTRVTAEIALYASLKRPVHLDVKRVMFVLKPYQNVS